MRKALLFSALLAFGIPSHSSVLRGGSSGSTPPTTCSTGTTAQIAACLTAQNNALCTTLGDYYTEIDSSTTLLWSYQQGTSINRVSLEQLDSGTKPIDGAYWVQYRGGVSNLTADDVLHLHQQSGYVTQPAKCSASGTVLACLANTPNTGCSSATGYTIDGITVPSTAYGALCTLNQGIFTYNGGNFQTHAAIDGPSSFYNLGRSGVANAVNTELGTPTLSGVTFTNGSATITNTGTNGLVAGMHVYLTGTVPTPFSNFTTGTTTGIIYYVVGTPTATSFQLAAKGSSTPIVAGAGSTSVTVTVMPFTYSMPLLAGGANQSAAGVIVFLQNIIGSSPLLYNGALGTYETCTNYPGNGEPSGGTDGNYIGQMINGTVYGSPSASITVSGSTTINAIGSTAPNGPWISSGLCQTNSTGVGGSPIPENMLYSVAHWVESDPAAHGDGAFSGIGSKGAYLWVDRSKTYVGVLMRVGSPGTGYNSTQCGRLLRAAYLTGIQQTGSIPTSY